MKNVLKPLTIKKILGSGNSGSGKTKIIILNKEMKNMKIIKSLRDSGLFIKDLTQIENETRNKSVDFLVCD